MQRESNFGRLVGGGLSALLVLALSVSAQLVPDLSSRVNEAYGLSHSRVAPVAIEVLPATGDVLVGLDLDGQPMVLELSRHSLRAPGFQVLEAGADGSLVSVDPGPVATLRGSIAGVPGSEVAGALLDEGLFARLHLPGGDALWIEPIAARVPGASPADHVLYRGEDVLETGETCGTELLADARPVALPKLPGPSIYTAGASTAELACDADYEYFQHWGTVSAVQNRIETVLNTVNQQYESEVGISHTITTIIVRTSSSQPYTSTDAVTLLNQFRNQWNANHGGVQRDVAQLFTGKQINGGTIGIAWVGVVCNLSYAYSMVQSDFNGGFSCATDLSAHELGHNWNADHCSCTSNTMNPWITCANTFSPVFTIPEIVAYRDAVSCLAARGGGDPPAEPTSVHVASVTAQTVGLGKGNKGARAVVVVVDDVGNPVAGASVTGTFSGDATGTTSATTDGSGAATLTSGSTGKGKFNFTFCVTSVTASLPYAPGDNVATCGSN